MEDPSPKLQFGMVFSKLIWEIKLNSSTIYALLYVLITNTSRELNKMFQELSGKERQWSEESASKTKELQCRLDLRVDLEEVDC